MKQGFDMSRVYRPRREDAEKRKEAEAARQGMVDVFINVPPPGSAGPLDDGLVPRHLERGKA